MKNLKKIDKKTFKEKPKFFKYRKFLKIASIPFVIVGTGLGFYLQENNINEANAPLWFWIVLYVLLGIGIYIFGFAIYIVFKDTKIIANKIYAFMDAFKKDDKKDVYMWYQIFNSKCPYCLKKISSSAIKCPHCTADLQNYN